MKTTGHSKGNYRSQTSTITTDIRESKYFLDRMKKIRTSLDERGVNIDKTAEAIKNLLKKGITYKFGYHPHVYPLFETLLLRGDKENENKMALAVLKAFEDLGLLGSLTAGILHNEMFFSPNCGHKVIQKLLTIITTPVGWDPKKSKKAA